MQGRGRLCDNLIALVTETFPGTIIAARVAFQITVNFHDVRLFKAKDAYQYIDAVQGGDSLMLINDTSE